ncbi:hypothetical protein KGQ72_02960 [Patescibacteria group bacterium]|nr:hypothetical protein [Patescibacteria group bacterium]
METNRVEKFRFLPGLAGLFVGFIMWFLFSAIFGISQGVTHQKTGGLLLALSFAVMILAPLWYWILRIPYIVGKEKNKRWLKMIPVVVWWFIFVLVIFAGLSK